MKMSGVSALLKAAEAQETRAETIQPHEFLNERGKKKARTASVVGTVSQGAKQYQLQMLLDESRNDSNEATHDTATGLTRPQLLNWQEIRSTEFREFQCHTPDRRLDLRVGLTREKVMPNWWGVVQAGGQTRILEKRYETLEQLQQRAQHWWAWEWDGEEILSHQDRENNRYEEERARDKQIVVNMIAQLDIQELMARGEMEIKAYGERYKNRSSHVPGG